MAINPTTLKALIDTQITNETVNFAITPLEVGGRMKDTVDYTTEQIANISLLQGPQGFQGFQGPQYLPFKDITSLVITGVYALVNEDFTKSLIYTGSSNINVQITSSLSFVTGTSFTIIQKGAGQITVSGSGVNINVPSDVVPTTYGANSIADIIVYSSTEVIVSGKLKFA
jgi:hypothetical protein